MNEPQIQSEAPVTKKRCSINTTPIRVRKSTARTIKSLVSKLNKKQLGRKVLVDDIVSHAIALLSEKNLEQIKKTTYSSKDRLEIRYREHCQQIGHITKERFLELLLEANLQNQNSKDQNEK